MKKWLAFLLALSCLLSLCACGTEKENGEYVTVYLPSEVVYGYGYTNTYTYNGNGNQTSMTETKDGKETSRTTYTYDDSGNRTESVEYKNGEETCRYVYAYDENGNTAGVFLYEDGEEISRQTYAYDKDGNQTEICYYANGKERNRTTFTYDKTGNLIEESTYVDGEKVSCITYVHNEETNTVTEYHRAGIELTLHNIMMITYDERDRAIRKAQYALDDADRLEDAEPKYLDTYVYEGDKQVEYTRYFKGELKTHETKKYNEQGDTVSIIHIVYDAGHEYKRDVYEYEYTYDEEGNIIQKACYLNGEFEERSSWTCTYIAVRMTRKRAEELGYI